MYMYTHAQNSHHSVSDILDPGEQRYQSLLHILYFTNVLCDGQFQLTSQHDLQVSYNESVLNLNAVRTQMKVVNKDYLQ